MIFFMVWSETRQIICQKQIIQQHQLSGLKYSIYKPMTICPHVKDRCCTFPDEIKILKLWQVRTQPLMNTHADVTVQTLNIILNIFGRMRTMNPGNFNLKFKKTYKISYEQEVCNKEVKIEKIRDKHEFVKYFDNSIVDAVAERQFKPLTPYQVRKIISYEKDPNGERHWGAPYDR